MGRRPVPGVHVRRWPSPMTRQGVIAIYRTALALLVAVALVCGAIIPGASRLYGASAWEEQAAGYTIIDAGRYSQHWASWIDINRQGHLTSQTAGNQASLYDGTLRGLGIPKGDTWSYGQGINNADQIAASAGNDGTGAVHAYAVSYAAGAAHWQPLPGLPGYPNGTSIDITPTARAMTGAICPATDNACYQCRTPGPRAVVWRWTGRSYAAPRPLPLDTGENAGIGNAVVKFNGITLVAGEELNSNECEHARPMIWQLGGIHLRLSGPAGFPYGKALTIAHASGPTVYVGGEVWRSVDSAAEPAEWTVRCGSPAACRQVGPVRILSTMGFVAGVNARGWAVGYQRPGGDGAGDAMLWRGGTALKLASLPGSSSRWQGLGWASAINDGGQIAGVGVTAASQSHVFLLTPIAKPAGGSTLAVEQRRR